MGNQFPRVAVSLLLVSSFLSGCASTSSNGSAPLNQGNWPICSLIGGLAGGGLGSIESSAWAAGGAAVPFGQELVIEPSRPSACQRVYAVRRNST